MPFLAAQTTVVLLVIIRATWGYQKQSDVLATTVIKKRSGLPMRSVERSLSELRTHGLITCEGPNRHPKTITLIASRFLDKPGTAIQAARNVLTMPQTS